MPEGRLFLERRSYRKRRIMDAVRMLPFLCALLWIVVPAMWPTGLPVGTATPLSTAIWYIFTIWVLAITASFALWRRIGGADDADSVSDAGRNT